MKTHQCQRRRRGYLRGAGAATAVLALYTIALPSSSSASLKNFVTPTPWSPPRVPYTCQVAFDYNNDNRDNDVYNLSDLYGVKFPPYPDQLVGNCYVWEYPEHSYYFAYHITWGECYPYYQQCLADFEDPFER